MHSAILFILFGSGLSELGYATSYDTTRMPLTFLFLA